MPSPVTERTIKQIQRERLAAHKAGDLETEGYLWCELSSNLLALDQVEQALDAANKAQTLAEKMGDPVLEGHALGSRGMAYLHTGRVDRAVVALGRAVSLLDSSDDQEIRAGFLGPLGAAYASLDEYDQARDCHQQAREIAERLDSPLLLASSLAGIAMIDVSQGEPEQAIERLEQAAAIYDKHGNDTLVAETLLQMASAHAFLGRWEQVSTLCERAFAMADNIPRLLVYGPLTGLWGMAQREMGHPELALSRTQEAVAAVRALDNSLGLATIIGNLCDLYIECELDAEALVLLEELMSNQAVLDDPFLHGQTLRQMGSALAGLGRFEEALSYAKRVHQMAIESGDVEMGQLAADIVSYCQEGLGQADQSNLLREEIVRHAFETGDPADQLYALRSAAEFYLDDEQFELALEHLTKGLAIARRLRESREERDLQAMIGLAQDGSGQREAAMDTYQALLKQARREGDKVAEGIWLSSMANTSVQMGNHKLAIKMGQSALKIADEIGMADLADTALWLTATAYRNEERHEEALPIYERLLAVARETGNALAEGQVLSSMGSAQYELGRGQTAVRLGRQAVKLSHKVGDIETEAKAWAVISDGYRDQGRLEKAKDGLAKAIALYRQLGDSEALLDYLPRLAGLWADLAQHDEAIACLQESLTLARAVQDSTEQFRLLTRLSSSHRFANELEQATATAQEALNIAEAEGDRQMLGVALDQIGRAFYAVGSYADAARYFARGVETMRLLGTEAAEAAHQMMLAECYIALGRYDQAVAAAQAAVVLYRDVDPEYAAQADQWLTEHGDNFTS